MSHSEKKIYRISVFANVVFQLNEVIMNTNRIVNNDVMRCVWIKRSNIAGPSIVLFVVGFCVFSY